MPFESQEFRVPPCTEAVEACGRKEHSCRPGWSAAAEAPQTAIAADSLVCQMPELDDAPAHVTTLALVLPEAARAARNLLSARRSRA